MTAFPAFSAIVFSNPTVEIPPDPTLKEWVADYPFKNTGDKPVTIKEVRPCCNCTTTKLDKKSYAAGETGKLTLIFKTIGKTGYQEKHAVVTTDDGTVPSVIYLKGMIPSVWDSIMLSSQSLRWEKGEKRSPKKIQATLKSGSTLKLISATSLSKSFIVKLISINGGFEIEVTPPSESKSLADLLLIQTDFPLTTNSEIKINVAALSQ